VGYYVRQKGTEKEQLSGFNLKYPWYKKSYIWGNIIPALLPSSDRTGYSVPLDKAATELEALR